MDRVSEQRLKLVHPALAAKVRQMADMLAAEGIVIRVTQGLRTYAEQDAIYQQGRTTPGPIVTKAQAGSSYHNYGLAIDFCVGIPGSDPWQPDWKVTEAQGVRPTWARAIKVGKSLGMVSGSDFTSIKDYPHLQMTGNLPMGPPTAAAKKLLVSDGMQAVWKLAGLPES